MDLALADDIVSRLRKAVFVWQLSHKGLPSKMKLPKDEYNELMIEAARHGVNPPKFRGMEVERNDRNFIEFEY